MHGTFLKPAVAVMVLFTLLSFGCTYDRDRYDYDRIVGHERSYDRRVTENPSPQDNALDRSFTEKALTLKDCIHFAIVNNPSVHMAIDRIRQAEASVDEARSFMLPVLSFDTSYLWADTPAQSLFKTIDARSYKMGTDFNYPGTFHNYETGFSMRYNLYNGGRDMLRRWMAQTGQAIGELDLSVVRNALVSSVINAYYDIRAAEAILTTSRASTETVHAELEETRVKWKAGNTLKSDVLSLEVRYAEARESEILARNALSLAIAGMAHLLGGDADTPLTIGEEDWEPKTLPADYSKALGEALVQRPELERSRLQVERAAMGIDSARGAYHPRLDTSARAYWDARRMHYNTNDTNWMLGLNLTWDLFTGGGRGAGVDKAHAMLDEMLHADRDATLAVQLDVKTAFLRVEEARARTDVTEAGEKQAEESLELVRKQFEGGTATVTRYLEAEFMLTRARMRRTNALFDLKKSIADAARAMGRLTYLEPEADSRETTNFQQELGS